MVAYNLPKKRVTFLHQYAGSAKTEIQGVPQTECCVQVSEDHRHDHQCFNEPECHDVCGPVDSKVHLHLTH